MTPRAWLASIWSLIILVLCWIPKVYIPGQEQLPRPIFVLNIDKYIHLGIFFVFAFLWMNAITNRLRVVWVIFSGVVLAALSEIGQETQFVNRDANLYDGLADVAGVVLGIGFFWAIGWLKTRSKNQKHSAPNPSDLV